MHTHARTNTNTHTHMRIHTHADLQSPCLQRKPRPLPLAPLCPLQGVPQRKVERARCSRAARSAPRPLSWKAQGGRPQTTSPVSLIKAAPSPQLVARGVFGSVCLFVCLFVGIFVCFCVRFLSRSFNCHLFISPLCLPSLPPSLPSSLPPSLPPSPPSLLPSPYTPLGEPCPRSLVRAVRARTGRKWGRRRRGGRARGSPHSLRKRRPLSQ